MSTSAKVAVGAGTVVLVAAAVVVIEAVTHSGVGMWVGLACLLAIAVAVGSRVVGRYGGPGGGGAGGCGPGGC